VEEMPSTGEQGNAAGLALSSVVKKRRMKMNKHKHRKLRKKTRFLRKKLGKL